MTDNGGTQVPAGPGDGPAPSREGGSLVSGGEIDAAVAELRRQVADLTKKVASLTADVMEHKQLNRRVADLTDVVSQLLLPGSSEPQFRARLAAYQDSLEGKPASSPATDGQG